MTTKTPKNAELLILPKPALIITEPGSFRKFVHLNNIGGMK